MRCSIALPKETALEPDIHNLRRDAIRPGFSVNVRSAGALLAFPCDAAGRVDLDALGERALNDYLYARAVIGRELTRPVIEPRC